MSYFLLNLFLALSWMLINDEYSSLNFLVGFVIGFVALRISQPLGIKRSYFKRCQAAIMLGVYFAYEMLISVVRVTWDVITPTHLSEPDIVYVPLSVTTDLEITLLANMVSLTPGTLSLDISEDRQFLVVHAMFAQDHQAVIDSIKQGLERRLLEVTHG